MGVQIFLVFHVMVAICLIALVLVQQGKGAAMGAALGGGASATVFGSRGSRGFLYKLTGAFALAFFATSMTLTYLAAQSVKNARDDSDTLALSATVQPSDVPQAPIKPTL